MYFRADLFLKPGIFSRSIIARARIAKKKALHLPARQPSAHRLLKIAKAITSISIKKPGTIPLRKMARVVEMGVDVENAIGNEPVQRTREELLIGGGQLGDEGK